jgi:predicted nucleotidyltransferase
MYDVSTTFALVFGSMSTGCDHPESDLDVVLSKNFDLEGKPAQELLSSLERFAIESGQKLDLFIDNGFDFDAAYSDDRTIMVASAKHRHEIIDNLVKYGRVCFLENLVNLVELFHRDREKAKVIIQELPTCEAYSNVLKKIK